MSKVTVVDLRLLIMRCEVYIERFLREYPQHEDRVLYTRYNRQPLKDFIYNWMWNKIHLTTKYQGDELEEELYLKSMFVDYSYKSWYRNEEKDLIINDEGAFKFMSHVVEEIESDIETLISKNRIRPVWEIVSMDMSPNTITVELFGDWRAQKWCEENDKEYTPC